MTRETLAIFCMAMVRALMAECCGEGINLLVRQLPLGLPVLACHLFGLLLGVAAVEALFLSLKGKGSGD